MDYKLLPPKYEKDSELLPPKYEQALLKEKQQCEEPLRNEQHGIQYDDHEDL